jgi:hypothetical protein
MPIATQNWDSVTAPALPSGWNFSTASLVTTSSLSGGLTPTSSPNVLELAAFGTSAAQLATFATTDGNSGNVTVQANFAVHDGSSVTSTVGLFARSSSATPSLPSSSLYLATIDFANGNVTLAAYVSGLPTTLKSIATTAPGYDAWYQLTLSCAQTAISVAVQRLSDSDWLNSTGTFQPAAASAINVSDSSISGSGYSGLSLAAKTSTAYTDNWSLNGIVFLTPGPAILRPMCLPLSRALISGACD